MKRADTVRRMIDGGVVPCWRTDDTAGLIDAAKAMADVGYETIELTLTMPGALRLVERAAAELPATVAIGVGTVLDAATARLAILAGANYLVSPSFIPEVIATAHRYDVAVAAGAFTPTEIFNARSLGADVIKLYPAGQLGMGGLRDLVSVFPGLRTVASGGVRLAEIADWIASGTDAVVIGAPHFAPPEYTRRDYAAMARIAKRLLAMAKEGRDPELRKRLAAEGLARFAELPPERAAAR
ncbi:MAG: 2-dehydro-3-deoxyphosphogluconate aldolase [Planctomycetes bacterium]|nr:2-dehydro-3-deoxyphosphogluconate aldolase [Planctomycetota bacterium]